MATLVEIAAASTIAQISYLSPDCDKTKKEAASAGGLPILRALFFFFVASRAELALDPIRDVQLLKRISPIPELMIGIDVTGVIHIAGNEKV